MGRRLRAFGTRVGKEPTPFERGVDASGNLAPDAQPEQATLDRARVGGGFVGDLTDQLRHADRDVGFDSARRHQSASLSESFDATLKHVPFPARKLVKKVLLG